MTTLIGFVAVGEPSATIGQTQAASSTANPSFEVASVKPNKGTDMRVAIMMQPGGRFNATNVPLRALVRFAYQLQDFQMIGLPDWATSERFDVVAKAESEFTPTPPGTIGPIQLMLRSLLVERFQLAAHTETRDMPIYNLVLARNDGKLGEGLRPSTVDCAAMMRERGRGGRGGPPPLPPLAANERPVCGMRIAPGSMAGGGFQIAEFGRTLSQFVQRIVIDRTNLTGGYDIDLKWTPDQMPQGAGGAPPPGAPPLPPIDPNGPSIFTAVQEQLGLKLDAAKGPVEVVVVDKVERPIPD